jgi:hypothetical protein
MTEGKNDWPMFFIDCLSPDDNITHEMGSDMINGCGSLDTLLDLDGEIFMMDGGYWVKIEAKRVSTSPSIPHGVRYSLTTPMRSKRKAGSGFQAEK